MIAARGAAEGRWHAYHGSAVGLLSILVPTWNRAPKLAQLLACLEQEIAPFGNEVTVLVADNASDDATSEILRDAAGRHRWLAVHRQPENLGAARNMLWLVEHAPDSDYAWIFGDDDLLVPGRLTTVMALLCAERPAWLFVPYYFADDDGRPRHGVSEPGAVERYATSGALYIAHTHWLTFISGSLVRLEPLREAARAVGTASAYAPFLWAFRAGLQGPCLAAAHHVVRGSLDITWRAELDSYMTVHVVDLYDAGVCAGLSPEEFAGTLDARYLHGDGVWALDMWRTLPLERLLESVRRFPHSKALRAYLWTLAAERHERAALPVLAEAARAAGVEDAAQQLVRDGEAVFAAGDARGAAERFRAAAEAMPTLATAWNNLAVALYGVDQHAAEVAVGHALYVAPDDVDARLNRASILLARGDRQAAAADVHHVLGIEPGNAAAAELLQAATG
jgi:glycosyltransferase involved in cell wall biosynthesis